METREKLERLKCKLGDSHLFMGVSLDAVECFLENCPEKAFSAGSVILTPSQENRVLFLVLEGEVQVNLKSLDQQPYKTLGPGECFGEMSLVDDGKASAYVVAVTDCRVMLVEEELLWGMVDSSHGVARNMLFILADRVKYDNDAIVANQEQLHRWEYFALSDALTGFNNRRWFDLSIERILKRAHIEHCPLSAIMLDVDHFKRFNDSWGHLAGDQALRALATVVRNHMRVNDLAVRYGGEEFLVLLPQTALEQAERIAERLRFSIAETPCGCLGEVALPPITVSMGISCFHSDDSGESLLARADQALYSAKQAGRNCVVSHAGEPSEPVC